MSPLPSCWRILRFRRKLAGFELERIWRAICGRGAQVPQSRLSIAGKLDASYPPQVIDFDSTNLPEPILATLEEAIKAHGAGCFKASALMVRRLLEELCQDKNAVGNDLKARLVSLGGSVVIPQELLAAADELRILGNDAAHVEAKAYDAIGRDEATVAIELAKELLKAVYQYAALVSRLKALKKP
jgi:Domain of unknown function (DUF4145)